MLRDSNPGYVRINAGGVTRNILENLARMGLDCRLLTAVGRDALGDMALDATREAGVDVSRALRVSGEPTSTYCALLEPSGEMFAALSDMRILERLDDAYLDAHAALLSGADVVALDPSLPERAIDRVLELARGAPVFADPVSTAYAKKLLGRVGRFSMLKPNRMELEVLSRMRADTEAALRASAEKLVAEGCRAVYVTLGADGCAFADARGAIWHEDAPGRAHAKRHRRGGCVRGGRALRLCETIRAGADARARAGGRPRGDTFPRDRGAARRRIVPRFHFGRKPGRIMLTSG